MKTLKAIEDDARYRAARLDCKSPQVLTAAARVREAYSGFERITRMIYPGDAADWRADRGSGKAARWRLAQQVSFGRIA